MTPIRFASYNVHNLFVDERDGPPKTERELRDLAKTINKLSAHVLALQEVGCHGALAQLNALLEQPYQHIGQLPGNSDRNIHLAIMSRFPIRLSSYRERTLIGEEGESLHEFDSEEDAQRARLSPLRMQRDLLLCEVSVPGMASPLAFFGVHLKSKTNRPWRALGADIIRLAECRLIVEVLKDYLEQHPDAHWLLAGDFNDTAHSDALLPLRSLEGFDAHAESLAANGRNPSTYWPRRRMRIDRILLVPQLQQWVVAGSAEIHQSQLARRASDHYPVSVDIDLSTAGRLQPLTTEEGP